MGSPVDSNSVPEPWDMPGYTDKVIMAAGCIYPRFFNRTYLAMDQYVSHTLLSNKVRLHMNMVN